MKAFEQFNSEPALRAETALLACCGSERWARTLAAKRPYASAEALIAAGEALWRSLSEAEWIEAFAAHPRIGEKKLDTSTFMRLSMAEQESSQKTLADVALSLTRGNRAYEQKFGFLYIVSARGRTAPELLAVLEERLKNTREEELEEAARQQMLITASRMKKWLTL